MSIVIITLCDQCHTRSAEYFGKRRYYVDHPHNICGHCMDSQPYVVQHFDYIELSQEDKIYEANRLVMVAESKMSMPTDAGKQILDRADALINKYEDKSVRGTLNSCPRCGGTAEFVRSNYHWSYCQCTQCKFNTAGGDTDAEAIEHWVLASIEKLTCFAPETLV